MKTIIIIHLILLLALPLRLQADSVQATGRADAKLKTARQQALTDALANAVQQGAGVNILANTKIKDFKTEYYRVFARSFGYIRNYSIVKCQVEDGEYRVTIEAEVMKGNPDINDQMAIEQLVRLRGNPTFSVKARIDIENLDRLGPNILQTLLEQKLVSSGLKLIKDSTQALPDYQISASVTGDLKKKTYYNIPTYAIAADLELTAEERATGEIVAMSSKENICPEKTTKDPDQKLKTAITTALTGTSGDAPSLLDAFLMKIFTVWTTELDLGRIYPIYINGITPKQLQALTSTLSGEKLVSNVWQKGLSESGEARLEVETRLSPSQLTEIISPCLKDHKTTSAGLTGLAFARKQISEYPTFWISLASASFLLIICAITAIIKNK